jgi:hypothetical protein
MKLSHPALGIVLLATACAPTGDFPSLAKRPFEAGQAQTAPPAPPPIAVTISDPAALARVATALERVRGSVSPFEAGLAKAVTAVAAASGATTGSERWIEGQMAASRVEPLLEPASAALADIDAELRIVLLNPASADRAAIEAALAEASETVRTQADAVSNLVARLSR